MASGQPDEAQGLRELNAAAEHLWLAAQPRWPGLSIEVLPEVGSTNSHALHLGRLGHAEPLVVVAWRQTAGRGRMGRTWQAEPGQTLTLSVALPLNLGGVPGGASSLSLALGVAVAEALDALRAPHAASGPAPLQLKWPNDVWVADRKLAGLLIEVAHNPALPAQARWVVMGLGLNLWGTPPEWAAQRCDWAGQLPPDAPLPTPGALMQALAPALLGAAQQFEHEGFAAFATRYAARDALAGRTVALSMPSGAGHATPEGGAAPSPIAQGQAVGVDAQGALLICDALGHTQAWQVGEASVRPQPHPL